MSERKAVDQVGPSVTVFGVVCVVISSLRLRRHHRPPLLGGVEYGRGEVQCGLGGVQYCPGGVLFDFADRRGAMWPRRGAMWPRRPLGGVQCGLGARASLIFQTIAGFQGPEWPGLGAENLIC